MTIRRATIADLDFLVKADLLESGAPFGHRESAVAHRESMAAFILDDDKGAWVYEDTGESALLGMILCRYRNRLKENFPDWSGFNYIDSALFPRDGNFCELFQLWVEPDYRRKGIATALKVQAEIDARARGVEMIYTHTVSAHTIVLHLNRKLGYTEVRRGKLWDDVERVSLIKSL
jgi:ribosomal protein S18 acetylase RimI-like enzyme